jgi:type I restriction enzyme, S subunit
MATNLLLGPPVGDGSAGPGQVTLRPGWRLIPFRRLFREIDTRSQTGSETHLSVSQTRGVIPQAELGDRRQYADTLVGYKVCMSGDLVLNRMWVYYGALGAASVSGIVSPDYAVFRPTAEMSSKFAAYVLRTPAYVGEMTRLVRGIGAAFQGTVRKPRLHPSELGMIQMPAAPNADQQRLVRALDEGTEEIAHRVSLLERSVELLEERRHALITEAVTGQLNIPEAA